jgi:hypothetical protein
VQEASVHDSRSLAALDPVRPRLAQPGIDELGRGRCGSEPNIFGYLPIHVYREFYRAKRKAETCAIIAHDWSITAQQADGEVMLEWIEKSSSIPQQNRSINPRPRMGR